MPCVGNFMVTSLGMIIYLFVPCVRNVLITSVFILLQLFMSCAHTEAAIVTVNLDRSVFLAGDDVKVQLTTSLPSGQRVKVATCFDFASILGIKGTVCFAPLRESLFKDTILYFRLNLLREQSSCVSVKSY